ncbi:chemotaxis protein methyltransferase CheR [Neobacillus bataviensis]|uniref:Chemotaxis protein methyltransferase CheR n=1 Tax=Neobacillus bataviensis TaxID=220685 RepID=A0A561CZ65_9BACI|nr:protein-glutamate O-methyltransferase CheR [Neobacillus bataviensis]TWD96523.1 chemotaxis protein methyltransferase CheR [Neobacillus bataviensis]
MGITITNIDQLQKIEIELLLEAIYRHYGYDFRNYAAPFIQRRALNRMTAEKLRTISGLQEKVLHDPLVMDRLFYDFSINVTEMFRDPSFFKVLREKVIPIVREYPAIRIWHVGCGSGEEVYSMAILLHEEGVLEKTKIYATDINQVNLEKAKQGSFPLEKMKLYTTNYIQSGGEKAFSEYYSVKNEQVAFHSFLKKNIDFFQHNLVTDQSFNEFHIIICRNVMIYFNKELQNHVHRLFYESLFYSGFLGLGKREEIRFTDYAKYYEVLHSAERLYRKNK